MDRGRIASLWDWALSAYGAPGVSEAWTAATGRALDADTIEAACDAARAWEAVAVLPLRTLRRTLKKPIPDIGDAGRQALRDQVKAVELAAERYLMVDLEALIEGSQDTPRPAIEALVAVARVWSRVVPRAALTTLAERLPA